jgi:hypothetical protein
MAMATPANSWLQHYTKATALLGGAKRDEAVVEFYIGQLRGRTNLSCVKQEPSGGPALFASLNEVVGRPINEYAGASPDKWIASIDAALAWDLANPDPENGSSKCTSEKMRQRGGLTGLRKMIDTQRDTIREERRKNGLPHN